jgi:phenylacetic acid degradation operon negative regulatory protein
VVAQQCTHFHGAATDISADKMQSLFSLDGWIADARVLDGAMEDALDPNERDDSTQRVIYEFALSIAVVRHLQFDPLLPVPLVGEDWPGHTMRGTYRRFDYAFKRRMNSVFR